MEPAVTFINIISFFRATSERLKALILVIIGISEQCRFHLDFYAYNLHLEYFTFIFFKRSAFFDYKI